MRETNNKRSSYRTMVSFLCTLVLAVSIFSCNSDRIGGFEHSGMLQFGIQADTSGISNNQPVTKATVYPDLKPFLNTDLYKVEILQGAENTVIQTFDHYKDMPEQVELERGDYKIRASMGESKPAAFNSPRLEGVSDFIIKEDMTTKLNVICSLVNARLTVAYTDSFKMVYPRYTAAFTSSHTTEPFKFVQNESRAGWFRVNAEGEDLTCILTATPDTGAVKQFTVKIPAVKPKDNVGLIFNSSQETRPDRGLTVKITINEETTEKPVYVYVPDYMLPVKAVALESTGFAHEDAISLSNGGGDKDIAKIRIFAPGTIKYCWLTKIYDGNELSKYDLATVEGAAKALSENPGLQLPSILKLKDVSLNFTEMVNKLPRNAAEDKKVHTYDYILQVQDSLVKPHISDPLTLRVKMIPNVAPQINVSGFTSGLQNDIIEGGVSSDGSNIAQTYKATVVSQEAISTCSMDITGVDGKKTTYSAPSLSELATKASIAYDSNSQTFDFSEPANKLETPSGSTSNASYILNVSTQFEGTTYTTSSNLNLSIAPPKFEMTMNGDAEWNGDAFAKRALLRAKVAKGKMNGIIGFEYKDGSTWNSVPEVVTIDKDEEATLVLKGLTPQKSYAVRAVYGKHKSAEIAFTTEAVMQLPNVSEKGIDKWFSEPYGSGGRTIWYPWNKDDEFSKGWDTSNKESMQSGNGNIYESAPSVMEKDGKTLIRTVGWATTGGSLNNWGGYLKGDPVVGRISFDSDNSNLKKSVMRPINLSFDYTYVLKSSSKLSDFDVSIILKSIDGDVISKGSFTAGAGTKKCNLAIVYPKSAPKAVKMEIVIKSDIKSTIEGSDAKGSGGILGGKNPPSSEIIGSQLTITNLQLNYE